MLSNVDKNIFINSDEINLLPIVSAEWNQNLFNPPYITIAGNGQNGELSYSSGTNGGDAISGPLYTLPTKTINWMQVHGVLESNRIFITIDSTISPKIGDTITLTNWHLGSQVYSDLTGTVVYVNQYNQPYLDVSGITLPGGLQENMGYCSLTAPVDINPDAHPNFQTFKFSMTNANTASILFSGFPYDYSAACKIITYVKTNNDVPIMLNAFAKGYDANDALVQSQYGSTQIEINSYGWTKVEIFMGGSSQDDFIENVKFTMAFNTLANEEMSADVFYTEPEIYSSQFFNYQYNSLWPTDAPFAHFRPGESYVETGNQNISLPSSFRQINSNILGNLNVTPAKAPVSCILENPKSFFITQYHPLMKNILPTSISPYKYFISDIYGNEAYQSGLLQSSTMLTSVYPENISTNKIVIKLNTLMSNYSVDVYINTSYSGGYDKIATVSAGIGETDAPDGVITLYYNNGSWSTSKWSTVPYFNDSGALTEYTTINRITVDVTPTGANANFPDPAGKTESDYYDDIKRAQIIEVSPRLEIDLTQQVQDVSVNKQIDSKTTIVPLSTLNADDASITLSGIPAFTGSDPIPLFSNQSNSNLSILSDMLRKNIKFYINWKLISYSLNKVYTESNSYIPAGVFYSDSWSESDIDNVKIQCFDIVRYLQSVPVPDYVASYKSVFDIISTLLDRVGFSDYDIDTLYSVTNDKASPMDMSYYYANSQDKTIAAALSELFLAYQIGAYIDEYGIMKFISLSKILNSARGSEKISIGDDSIYQGGYSATNIGKIGKISLRYQEPRVKQSLALQNAKDPTQRTAPSFIYTTSNEQVWMSNSLDSVGFNFINDDMLETDNSFYYNINDLMDIFHTFNLNNKGYVAVENEIMSFDYKEYSISSNNVTKTVSVKNDVELASAIDSFVKSNSHAELTVSDGVVKPDSVTNVVVSPTGRITNVRRGLFGTAPSEHIVSGNLDWKLLSTATATSLGALTIGGDSMYESTYNIINKTTAPDSTNPSIKVIECAAPVGNKVLLFPSVQEDIGYQTYSTKFNIYATDLFAGGIFFNLQTDYSLDNSYFVEFVKSHSGDKIETIYDFTNNETSEQTTPIYQYFVIVYQNVGGVDSIKAWADVTSMVNNIVNNFEKVMIKQDSAGTATYEPAADEAFQLKVLNYNSDGSDGEDATTQDQKRIVDVYINNAKVVGWMIPDDSGEIMSNLWRPANKNKITSSPQLPVIDNYQINGYSGSKFGVYMSSKPATINTQYYDDNLGSVQPSSVIYNKGIAVSSTSIVGSFREIYAAEFLLKDRSTNYWYQTQQFLNGLVQNQNIFNLCKTYMMQTTPTLSGINVYDVQYQQVAATNVDILPIQYYQKYFPQQEPADKQYVQEIVVDEYSLSYSTPINTGFRAKFAIANNSPYMVWIHKDPDDFNSTNSKLVLWTHEIISPSDPAIVERVLNSNNATEVSQVDSPWIQSAEAASKMIGLVAHAIDGFSIDTNLKIFGNPLIQVGDIVSVTYKLSGINKKLFVVQSVKHTFTDGLETDLVLNAVGHGVQY